MRNFAFIAQRGKSKNTRNCGSQYPGQTSSRLTRKYKIDY
jgi:hypothetical protein